jgi:hypothetical protein
MAFRRKFDDSIPAVQTDLDALLDQYNNEREYSPTARRLCAPSSIRLNSPRSD